MNMAEAIKRCAMEAFQASVPCDAVFGTVVGEEPVQISVGEMVIEGDVLTVAEHLLYKDRRINFSVYERTVIIHEGLKTGDTVLLLRKRGGESYIAIAKI